ncbi:hypothetical protein [Nonomuraea cavernae]|uniref:Uncharacterized protein n=1 Tax=Nonomuraea cavernae TaxID=2045107 RepID=A0A917YS61_9ACTN|nr:hypothetical protein [Nonomuraea cavernae]MCA2184216.1 hypothetical protein [Nonomuraea cavernae]GGO62665.1 hypothetical protein GCM10012289_07860 [Nonomuraea cavernae]
MSSDLVTRILYRTGFVVRLVLLFPLLGGLAVASASSLPSSRTLEQFRSVMLAGEVDRITYEVDDSDQLVFLVWSESPFAWRRVEGRIADFAGPYTTARLTTDLGSASVQPSLVVQQPTSSSRIGVSSDWPFGISGGWWVSVPWLLAFLAMLRFTPRLANRWAWFWLFTVGQIGVFVYLILEPRPLWRGPGEGLTRAKRVNGSGGCGYSILLALASVPVALGIAWLVALATG